MIARSLNVTDDLYQYLVAHSTPLDQLAHELTAETREVLPNDAKMQVAPEQVAFLTMLTQLTGARRVVEVGTFTGMSALAIARGLPTDGRLTCFDVSAEFTRIAQRYWQRAGVADRIELRLGPAAQRLAELPAEPHLDLAFIDADKGGYWAYWSELVPRLRPGGVVVVDNVLWSGQVLDRLTDDPEIRAIQRFNELVLADDRVDRVMLPIADGLTLARRR